MKTADSVPSISLRFLILPSLFRKCRNLTRRTDDDDRGESGLTAPPEIFPVIAAWATRPINRTAAAAADPQTDGS